MIKSYANKLYLLSNIDKLHISKHRYGFEFTSSLMLDDGYASDIFYHNLSKLYGIKGTIYIVGKYVEEGIVKNKNLDSPYEIGNYKSLSLDMINQIYSNMIYDFESHSYSHFFDSSQLNEIQLKSEITRNINFFYQNNLDVNVGLALPHGYYNNSYLKIALEYHDYVRTTVGDGVDTFYGLRNDKILNVSTSLFYLFSDKTVNIRMIKSLRDLKKFIGYKFKISKKFTSLDPYKLYARALNENGWLKLYFHSIHSIDFEKEILTYFKFIKTENKTHFSTVRDALNYKNACDDFLKIIEKIEIKIDNQKINFNYDQKLDFKSPISIIIPEKLYDSITTNNQLSIGGNTIIPHSCDYYFEISKIPCSIKLSHIKKVKVKDVDLINYHFKNDFMIFNHFKKFKIEIFPNISFEDFDLLYDLEPLFQTDFAKSHHININNLINSPLIILIDEYGEIKVITNISP